MKTTANPTAAGADLLGYFAADVTSTFHTHRSSPTLT